MATAAVYLGKGTIGATREDDQEPGWGEVCLAVAYTGICGTDLHVLHGAMDHRVRPPQVLGHEMSGRIEAVGAGVTGWSVGQPVTVMPLVSCGECPACRAGFSHVCHRLVFVGIDSPGSMRTRWIVPVDLLVAVPEEVPLRQAALVEPTAVATHDVRRSELVAGEHAVVIGGGPVGVLIALIARARGAEVVVIEPNVSRREIAEDLGLPTLDPVGDDVAAFVASWTGGAGASVVFEVSGAASAVTTAVDLLAVRGRLVMVAIHHHAREVNLHRFFWRELTMLGARVYEREDFEAAVDLIHSGRIPIERLVSVVVPLDQASSAFRALEQGGGVMKALIDCQDTGCGEESG